MQQLPFPRLSGSIEMKASALKERAELKYETTAGAVLPILESVARSLNSDGIIK